MIDAEVVPRYSLQLPRLYPKQLEFISSPKKISVTFASTKSGKTVACGTKILTVAWEKGGPGRDCYWFAPAFAVADIMYRRMKKWLRRADPGMTIWRGNDSDHYIELIHGGRIYFKGAERPDNLYGPDAIFVVIDEGTRCRAEILDVAVSLTTATEGKILIIGNMKGRSNWQFLLWTRGMTGTDQDVSAFKLDAYDAVEGGVIKLETIESAQRTLPEHVFRALYLCEPADSGTNPFGIQAIAACAGPGSCATPAAVGCDLAKSTDWTVVLGLDKFGHCCLFDRFQQPWLTTVPRLVSTIGKSRALVDSTGVGDPIVEQLQSKLPNVQGFKFTSQSKQQIIEGLAVAIQQGEVHGLPDIVRMELECFEYEYSATGVKYSAPQGMHDDTVCALALAVFKLGKITRSNSGRIAMPITTGVTSPWAGDLEDVGVAYAR